MRILVLDDMDIRLKRFQQELVGHIVDYAKTSAEAITLFQTNRYDLAFLDHDLGGETMVASDGDQDTGFKVAKYLLKSDINQCPKHIIVHSCNTAGADNMKALIHHIVCIPFVRLDISGAASRIQGFIERNAKS